MRKTEKYRETIERERTLAIYCDFCGKDINKQTTGELEKELSELYEFNESGYGPEADVTVEIRMSNSYPECGASKTVTLDVCAACFKSEIFSRAKTSNVSETDW